MGPMETMAITSAVPSAVFAFNLATSLWIPLVAGIAVAAAGILLSSSQARWKLGTDREQAPRPRHTRGRAATAGVVAH